MGTALDGCWFDPRDDLEVTTMETDAHLAAVLRDAGLPAHVRPVEGDAVALLPQLGVFDELRGDVVIPCHRDAERPHG